MNQPEGSTAGQPEVLGPSGKAAPPGESPPSTDGAAATASSLAAEAGPPVSAAPENPVVGRVPASNAPAFRVYDINDSFHRQDMPPKFHWSVVWSDLMMTMFILFAVMFVFQAAHRDMFDTAQTSRSALGPGGGNSESWPATGAGPQGPVDPVGPMEGSITRIFDVANRALDAEGIREFTSIDLASDRAMRIVLAGDLLFDPGRAALKPKALDALVKIGGLIRNTPFMINVAGHTDSVPIHTSRFATNWELSAARAAMVARFLIEEMQVPAPRVSVTGHAHYQPVAPNDTETNRAANRRVEIVITKEDADWVPADYRKLLDSGGGG